MMCGGGPFFGVAYGHTAFIEITILLIIVGGCSLITAKKRLFNSEHSCVRDFILLFSIWASLSIFWTISRDHTARLFVPIALGAFIFLSLETQDLEKEFCTKIISAVVLSTAFISIYAVIQVIDIQTGALQIAENDSHLKASLVAEQVRGFRPGSVFKDPNSYGSLLSILFPLIIFLILHGDKKEKVLYFTVLILNTAGLFLVASRGPAILAIISSIAVFLYMTKFTRKLVISRIKVIFGTVSILLFLLLFHLVADLFDCQSLISRLIDFEEMLDSAMTRRFLYWKAAFAVFCDYPVLGTGLNTIQQIIFPYLQEGSYTRFPHNIVLQFMAELGLVGALLFALATFYVIRNGIRKAGLEPFKFCCLLSFLNLTIYALVDITFQCATVVLLYFFLAALIHGSPKKIGGKFSLFQSWLNCIFIVLVLAMLLFAGYEGIRTYQASRDLETIKKLAAQNVSQNEIETVFKSTLRNPDILTQRAFADWLIYRYSTSNNLKLFDRGVKRLENVYQRAGKNPYDAYNVAKAFVSAGKLDEAEKWYLIALRAFPSCIKIWRDYAILLESTGRDKKLIEILPVLLRGVALTPRLERYYSIEINAVEYRLAGILRRNGLKNRSLKLYQEMEYHYRDLTFIEALDPLESRRVRIEIKEYLKDIRNKIDAIQRNMK